ncbi:MAG TPA: L,D-transpeptidase [Pseudolabrys sp.]|jgi:lipoprotein-anchoring transpeptidase ErfK/SrfK|nr:L,D-transpeptidase [Pseudolabrys sp.]
MNRRSFALLSILAVSAALPLGAAFAQPAAGPQVYRDQPQNSRGMPPSWLIDEDARPVPPPAQPGSIAAQPLPPVDGSNQGSMANAAPSAAQDAIRPPAAIGAPATTAPQGGTVNAALPPEDQPEEGQPKELPANLKKQLVDYHTKEPAGTIVIDTPNTYLYLVLGGGKALRYGIGVGREGFTWAGTERISRMKEWPDWFPPSEMIERQPYLPRMMAGGPGNPLGARALYLGNTLYRIHGTNQPSTIGQTVSSGCIRLLNSDIEDLFSRVQVGTRVVVLPGQPPHDAQTASVSAPAAGTALPPAPSGAPQATINGLTGKPIHTSR